MELAALLGGGGGSVSAKAAVARDRYSVEAGQAMQAAAVAAAPAAPGEALEAAGGGLHPVQYRGGAGRKARGLLLPAVEEEADEEEWEQGGACQRFDAASPGAAAVATPAPGRGNSLAASLPRKAATSAPARQRKRGSTDETEAGPQGSSKRKQAAKGRRRSASEDAGHSLEAMAVDSQKQLGGKRVRRGSAERADAAAKRARPS